MDNKLSWHMVMVEKQGHHPSLVPPEGAIKAEVESFLNGIWRPDKPTAWRCHIICRRIPAARGYSGVRVVRLMPPYKQELELRVRIADSDLQWQCFLFAPTAEEASQIISTVRSDALSEMKAASKLLVSRIVETERPKTDQRDDRQTARKLRRTMGVIRSLTGNEPLRRICWKISNCQDAVDASVPVKLIRQTVEAETGKQFTDEQLVYFCWKLVEEGILEPATEDSFLTTPVLIELAQEYSSSLREKRRQEIENRLHRLQRRREVRVIDRTTAERDIDSLNQQIEQTKAELEREK